MYRIVFANSAAKEFRGLSKQLQRRIRTAIDKLQEDPRPEGVRKLSGHQDLYRIRIGQYRVVYEIKDEVRVLTVTRVRHRSDVYR